MTKKHPVLILSLLTWTGFVLAAFYIVQKPTIIQVASGLLSILWTILLTILFLVDAACIGEWILYKFKPSTDKSVHLILSTGLGMGILGLSVFVSPQLGLTIHQFFSPY
jgi:hypothetical protein